MCINYNNVHAASVSAAVGGRVAQVRGRPSVRWRVRDEDGHVAQAVHVDQEPRARLRPVHGRVDDERLRRRRERRGLLPADRVHGRGVVGGGRAAPAVRRRAAAVADGAAGVRAAVLQRRLRRDRRTHRVRQGAHTSVPVDGGRRRQ